MFLSIRTGSFHLRIYPLIYCNSCDNWLIYSWAICSVSYLDSWVSGPKPGSTVLNLSNPWLRRSILLLSRAFAARRLFFNTDSDISSSGFFTFPGLLEYFNFRFWFFCSFITFCLLSAFLLLRSTGWISCRGRFSTEDEKENWDDLLGKASKYGWEDGITVRPPLKIRKILFGMLWNHFWWSLNCFMKTKWFYCRAFLEVCF